VRVAGQLAIAGAGLLVLGLFPGYQYNDPLRKVPEAIWYTLVLAALALAAGWVLLALASAWLEEDEDDWSPGRRRLIGPGLLLGIAPASTWGLLTHVNAWWMREAVNGYGSGFWLQLAAHLVLVLAACLAGLALARAAEVRLMRRLPGGELPWIVVLLGAAGAAALFAQDRTLWDAGLRWYVAPSIWATILALIVPACAAVARPREFGISLLMGWIGGGASLFIYYFVFLFQKLREGIWAISMFGLTLLALLVITYLFGPFGVSRNRWE
jgi:hypothetical protein